MNDKRNHNIHSMLPLAASLTVCTGAALAKSGSGYDNPDNWPQYHRSFNLPFRWT